MRGSICLIWNRLVLIHTQGKTHTHKSYDFWFRCLIDLWLILICSNWLRRKVFITYLTMKWNFSKLCSYHISKWVLHFEDNLFVRSGDYELAKHLKELRYCAQWFSVKRLWSPYTLSIRSKSILVQEIRHKFGLFYFNIKLVILSFLHQ